MLESAYSRACLCWYGAECSPRGYQNSDKLIICCRTKIMFHTPLPPYCILQRLSSVHNSDIFETIRITFELDLLLNHKSKRSNNDNKFPKLYSQYHSNIDLSPSLHTNSSFSILHVTPKGSDTQFDRVALRAWGRDNTGGLLFI